MAAKSRDRKGAIGLWIAVFVGILVLVGAELVTSYFRAVEQSQRSAHNLAHLLSERIAGTFREAELGMRGLESRLASALPLSGAPSAGVRGSIRAELRQRRKVLPFVSTLAVYSYRQPSRYARVASVGPPPREGADLARLVRDGSPAIGAVRARSGGLAMALVHRLHRPGGETAGFVACLVGSGYFRRELGELGLGRGGSVAVLDGRQRLLARRPPVPGQRGKVFDSPLLQTRLEGKEVASSLRAVSPLSGEAHRYAFRRVRGSPLVVLVGAPGPVYLGAWGLKLATYVGGTALLLSLLVLLMRTQLRNLRLARDLETRSVALESADDMVMITDPQGIIEYVNPSFERATGYSRGEVRGRRPSFLHDGRQEAEVEEELWRTVRAGRSWKGELVSRRKDGRMFTGEETVSPVQDREGKIVRFVAVMRDVTERKRLERKLEHRATHDPLTGVCNRQRFQELLNQEAEEATRYGRPVSLILLDIDHFKQVNDSYGHAAGDRVLERVTEVLQGRLRASDVLGRWGGEEFMVLLPETSLSNARKVAEDLRASLESASIPTVARVTASFGVTELKRGEPRTELLRRVDEALYRAKEAGRNRVRASEG
ncbi:MAG TPA: diguanylate cyclase [Gammaproteobacteria bacterium]|nr:diguanylate cyclase [Gammaproteobacteria bacterium]